MKPKRTANDRMADTLTGHTDPYRFMLDDGVLRLRRWQRREAILEMLGGKCVRCGAEGDDLHIDHIDPRTKSFDVARALERSDGVIRAEIQKCQLLCPSCHRVKTMEDLRLGRVSPLGIGRRSPNGGVW